MRFRTTETSETRRAPQTAEEESQEILRRALRLHEERKAREEREAAERAAAQEMEVSEEALEKARRQVRRETAKRARRKRETRDTLIGIAVAIGSVAGIVTLIRAIPASPPVSLPLGAASMSAWTFDRSSGTQASVRFEGDAARVEVRGFGREAVGPFAGQYFANVRSTQGPFNTRTLGWATFTARGQGLERVRLRFQRGDRMWTSDPVLLTGEWQTYRVSLDRLHRHDWRGGKWVDRGRRDDLTSKTEEVMFQFGEHVNPIDASGWAELRDLRLK